jgi:hypothetical protein
MSVDTGMLGIYLNDHLSGAAGGIALARRCRRSNPDPPLGPMLSELLEELRVDKRLLETIMTAHGIRTSRVKQTAAVAAERAGRLKFNGTLIGYSPLSRVVELEGLRLGVLAKRALWEALLLDDALVGDRGAVEDAVSRADSQLDRLEQARRDAVAGALLTDGR